MVKLYSTFLLLVMFSYLIAGAYSSNSFLDIYSQLSTTENDTSTKDNPASDADPNNTAKSLMDEFTKIISNEINKLHSSYSVPSSKEEEAQSKDTSSVTESIPDMIRRIVGEEIAKAIPAIAPSTPVAATAEPPQLPLWKNWANTKYWSKQPGPNGEAPAGFVGSLQNTFGGGGYGFYNGPPAQPGSPGWVWSQISSKWADEDPTVMPPPNIVKSGDWDTIVP